jgi:hypothetical protein
MGAHPKNLLRLPVEIGEAPFPIDGNERVADTFQYLRRVEWAGSPFAGVRGPLQSAALLFVPAPRVGSGLYTWKAATPPSRGEAAM